MPKSFDLMEDVPIYACTGDVKFERSTKFKSISKKWKSFNLFVSANESRIYVRGSLSDYHFGGDFTRFLSLNEVKRAIEDLSDDFHLPFAMAKVHSLEIGFNLGMDFNAASYYPYLTQTADLFRSEDANGIYYKNSNNPKQVSKVLTFYDKLEEKKNKGYQIQNYNLPCENLLRYELRIKHRLNEYFVMNEIKGEDLYFPHFFEKAWDKWVNEFMRIRKCSQLELDPLSPISPSDFMFQFLLDKVKQKGEDLSKMEAEMFDMIELLKRKGYFVNRMMASRYRKEVDKIFKLSPCSRSNDRVTELERKIKDTKQVLF